MILTNVTLPVNEEWGVFQVAHLPTTYFRFRIPVDKPVLDTTMFVDSEIDPDKKLQNLSVSSELYKGLQRVLDEYVANMAAEKKNTSFLRLQEEIHKMNVAQQLTVLSGLLEFIDGYFDEGEDREYVFNKVKDIIEKTKNQPI